MYVNNSISLAEEKVKSYIRQNLPQNKVKMFVNFVHLAYIFGKCWQNTQNAKHKKEEIV